MIKRITKFYNDLLDGKYVYDANLANEISAISVGLINTLDWSIEDQSLVDLILRCSNIIYNNTSSDVMLLDDGVYDQLLQRYKQYDKNYVIGAIPIHFDELPQNEIVEESKKVMCVGIKEKELDSKLFIRDIWKQNLPIEIPRVKLCYTDNGPITKRLINTKHKYPELVGTLDKCKFVLNNDAREQNVFDKPSVQIFERDFIHRCLNNGIISPTEVFEMVGELKYDGVSVEAEICGDTIISALSRGDTDEDIATDLTPILGGYKFPKASTIPKDFTYGMKFEAVITYYNLDRLSAIRGKSYKNGRNAIIGLFGASDAYKFSEYITLIPLATSLELPRIKELQYLNKYYNSGEYNRYVVMRGTYQEILFQVKQFTESAETIRKVLPYMIDGVVISFINQDKINKLGRENSVNKYSMAIKFNPSEARTNFIGYTYSIGKSGDVIPMVHFKPCEFIGAIHTKQTIHSYKRFKELNLIKGQQIDVKYVNDVISYVTKPDTEFNRSIEGEPEKFIEVCPYCGSKIVISESGNSAKCPNVFCPERVVMRMVDMINQLGFKDFSDERVRMLGVSSFVELLNISYDRALCMGEAMANQFIQQLSNLINTPIEDYKIMSSLGFGNMADEKWKIILKTININDIISMDDESIRNTLIPIKGIGPKLIDTIITGRNLYLDDLKAAVSRLKIIESKGTADAPKVAFTGFRDAEFIQLLNANGFDASDKYGITKTSYCLITENLNASSSKMNNAKKYGIPIYTKQQFLEKHGIKL